MKKTFLTVFILSLISSNSLIQANAEGSKLNSKIKIQKGFATYLNVKEGIKTVVVGNPAIASIVVPPKQNKIVLIFSKTLGETNLLLTSEKNTKSEIGISVNKGSDKTDAINLTLKINKAKELNIEKGIDSIIIADPMIAKINIVPGQNKNVFITPSKKGVTNLLVWTGKSDKPLNYIITVE